MKSILEKINFLNDAHKTASALLLVFLLSAFIEFVIRQSIKDVSFSAFSIFAVIFIICAFALYKKYRWGEVISLFLATTFIFSAILNIYQKEYQNFGYSIFFFAPIRAILGTAIFLLIFNIRFQRSKALTEEFEKLP